MTETNRYENGKIYKIVSPHTDKIYIGSTCKERLCQRLAKHKQCYKDWLNNNKRYLSIFELFILGDVEIILLESINCKTKDELLKKEREWIEKFKDFIVNKIIPIITKNEDTERNKKYYIEHKKEIKKFNKIYYENNKQELKQKNKIYRENHKEELKQKKYIYRENHKEQLNKKDSQRKKELYDCKCGIQLQKGSISNHNKSKFHLEHI